MKRETVRWLRNQPGMWRGMGDEEKSATAASADALATDAEVRRLRKALKKAEAALVNCVPLAGAPSDALLEVRAALKPKRSRR